MRSVVIPLVLAAAFCSSTHAQTCLAPPSGMVSWWTGDGNAADIRGGSNGTLTGGALFAPAQVGKGFVFLTDGDGVIVADNANLNVQVPGFTVDFWMKGLKNQSQPTYMVVDKSSGLTDSTGWFFQGNGGTGTITFGIGSGGQGNTNFIGVTSNTSNNANDLLDGNFHHVAGTWDGTQMRLYVDGIFQGSNFLPAPANNTRAVNMGFSWGGGTPNRFFRGIVDELQIYNRALSATEIGAIIAAGSSGVCRFPYYFSQFAAGGGWQTTLTLINYAPQVVECTTSFFSDAGGPLAIPFASGTFTNRVDIMSPGESVHEQTNAPQNAATVQGWAETVCGGPVKASLLYRLFQQGTAVGEAGVNGMTAPATKFVTFAETKTGIAYANPSSTQSALVTVSVINSGGTKIASTNFTLGPLGHGSANLGPLLGLQSFTGFVEITSSIPIVSLSLNAEAFPSFSSVPPGELGDSVPLAFP